MEKRFSLNLSHIWLLVSVFSLILPVFLPSAAGAQSLVQNTIGTVTATMFILSFPSSLFGLPILFLISVVLDLNPNSMQGMYLNLFLFFVLGLVQWFWLVPRLARKDARFQAVNLIGGKPELQLSESEAEILNDMPFYAAGEKTPLEKVFQEKDSD